MKSCLKCWSMLLIFLAIPPVLSEVFSPTSIEDNHNETETKTETETPTWEVRYNMTDVYTKPFTAVSGTNDNLEDLQSYHNLGYSDSKYWWATESSGTVTIHSISSLTGSTTNETTFSVTGASHKTLPKCRTYGSVIIVGIMSDNGATADYIDLRISLDSGSTWTTYNLNDSYVLTSGAQLIDLIYYDDEGTDRVVFIYGEISSTCKLGYMDIGGSSDMTYYNIPSAIQFFYTGNVVDGKYYYAHYFAGFAFSFNYYDLSTLTNTGLFIDSDVTAVPTSISFNEQHVFYFPCGNWIFIDSLYFAVGREGAWSEYTDTGTATNGIVWKYDDNNNPQPAYLFWKDAVFYITSNGIPYRISSFTDDAYVGWGDWITNGADTIYQATLTAFPTNKCIVSEGHLVGPDLDIIATTLPTTNLALLLYTSGGTLFYAGNIDSFEDYNTAYAYDCTSLIDLDLKTSLTESFTTQDVPTILKSILDSYGLFLHYSATSINTTPSTTYSPSWKNKTIKDVFLWAEAITGYYISIRPDGTVYFDQMTASGTSISEADGLGGIGVKRQYMKQSRIWLEGAINPSTGTRYTLDRAGEPNSGIYFDQFSEADESDLEDIYTALVAQKNQTLTKVIFIVLNQDLYYGQSYTLSIAQYSISSDTYYIHSTTKNYKTNALEMISYSALFTPPLSDADSTEKRFNNIEQTLGATATTVAGNTSSITTANGNISDLGDDVGDLEDRVTANEEDISDLDDRVSANEDAIAALGTPTVYAARAYRSTAQSIANNTVTVMQYNAEDYDLQSNYNTSTYKFVAPVEGVYHVDWSIMFTDASWAASEVVWSWVTRNGVEYAVGQRWEFEDAEQKYMQVRGSTDVYCEEDDYLQITVKHIQGATVNTFADRTYNFLNIHKVN